MSPLLSTFSAGSVRGYRLNRGTGVSGQQAYTTAGTYTFTVPAGVTSISVLCISGGGGGAFLSGKGGNLAYSNNISVTAGQTYTVIVGNAGTAGFPSIFTQGGTGGSSTFQISGGGTILVRSGDPGTSNIGDVSYSGGSGDSSGNTRQGAGGAAGYAGNGGAGGFDTYVYAEGNNGGNGTGGGGGGGSGGGAVVDGDTFYSYAGGNGGGVGILGQGANGTGGIASPANIGSNGTAGSGGSDRVYGGGGACGSYIADIPSDTITAEDLGTAGGVGAVRIIWGSGRSYPNNAGNV